MILLKESGGVNIQGFRGLWGLGFRGCYRVSKA